MASKVGCTLEIREANNLLPVPAPLAKAGTLQIRIRLRYQLRIKAHGVELLLDEVFTPEFVTDFSMPISFLLPELSVMFVSDMLADLNVDAQVREFSSPRIAEFAVNVAKCRGEAVSDFMTVAHLCINKTDYILEEEFDRISKDVGVGLVSGVNQTSLELLKK